MGYDEAIVDKVKETVIRAATTFREDQKRAYEDAILRETDKRARWILETLLENALVAARRRSPLCDDTGVPHLYLEVGKDKSVSGALIDLIHVGLAKGLRELPGRPMAVKGDERQRLDQSGGLDDDPGAVSPAPLVIRRVDESVIRLHVLLLGGGPEIRGKTYRVFHRHSLSALIDEIVNWAIEGASQLGCTPCVVAAGIGRSHFEATSLMLEAMIYGDIGAQSVLEREITKRVNVSGIGPLGLTGSTTALGTLLRIGPQRASGVRIVCLRLCCCVEPRRADLLLS